jgi:hypothetical protein
VDLPLNWLMKQPGATAAYDERFGDRDERARRVIALFLRRHRPAAISLAHVGVHEFFP